MIRESVATCHILHCAPGTKPSRYALRHMGITSTIVFFVTLVALTALSRPLAMRLRLPVGAVQIIFGFAVALLVTQGMELDTGLRASSFHDLVVFVLLPVVLFQAAYGLTTTDLFKDLGHLLRPKVGWRWRFLLLGHCRSIG